MKGIFNAIILKLFPGVEAEFKFHPQRKWKFDYCWPPHKIALEVEGGIWMKKGAHNTGKAILRDIEKYNEAALLGWRVFRTTPQQIEQGETIVLLERIFNNHIASEIDRRAEKWKKHNATVQP